MGPEGSPGVSDGGGAGIWVHATEEMEELEGWMITVPL